MPNFFAVSTRLFEIIPSEASISLRKTVSEDFRFRSMQILRTPLFKGRNTRLSLGANGVACLHGSPAGGSTFMTSAPISANSCPPQGPATKLPNSIIRIPSNGPAIGGLVADMR